MDFSSTKPIYIQIADLICDRILSGGWKSNERIPSVRELGASLEVNPNTAMRAYEWLDSRGIIYNRRGIGFFVSENAQTMITEERKDNFMNNELVAITKQLKQLNISPEEFYKRVLAEYNK